MINILLFQLFSLLSYDIILGNGFFCITKKIYIAFTFYYKNLCNKLMKDIKNKDKQLNDFCVFLFVILGIFLILYIFSFFAIAFKTIYTLITHQYNLKYINHYSFENKKNKDISHNNFSILNELLKSKDYLFSI